MATSPEPPADPEPQPSTPSGSDSAPSNGNGLSLKDLHLLTAARGLRSHPTSVDGDSEAYHHSAYGSIGEESLDFDLEQEPEDLDLLSVDAVHRFIGSEKHHCNGVPRAEVLARVAGTGLAPWEIHRPQKFIRELVLRRGFSGRVLDAGCGIGDNALYVAKACPAAEVTAVDVVPRCLEFAHAKAGIRNMRGKVDFVVADLTEQDPAKLPPALQRDHFFDVVLDSSTFHCFGDEARSGYQSTLRRLVRPGGVVYMNCMSEDETRPGGPGRVPVADIKAAFNPFTGWEVEAVEDSVVELHPTFWAGRGRARLYTIRRL
ncbi:hypothetical protein HYH03_014306 [Edaphochlamys debaryana]|uniref:Methyltransferase domain-containing protein n=1 Tax=Edaphochlamys debaryana TaxID=47281 RepID=A0A836BSB0_9CHLO|nr:hypothetical protein HYH03_014306 [Edaphochlamys debaryana]|eukprot:KAG2487060.1 hypothetical protein HYH03_014306 [Edaphochlamys debaryana]